MTQDKLIDLCRYDIGWGDAHGSDGGDETKPENHASEHLVNGTEPVEIAKAEPQAVKSGKHRLKRRVWQEVGKPLEEHAQ